MRMSFTNENKAEQRDNFPKLSLKQDEKARIFCPENPVAQFVHNMRMPKIENGRPVYKTVKDRDGNEKQVLDFDFVGRPICLGDVNILQEKGVDPKNCPVCREAQKSDTVDAPVRRFAMHVVKYGTKADGSMAKPFTTSVVVWSFTDNVFGKLIDIVNETGDLKDLDLILTCKTAQFQQYDIMPSQRSWRKEDEKYAALAEETFKENQAKDLNAFCGRKSTSEWIENDIQKIRERWDIVNNRSSASNSLSRAEESTLTEGLDDLLGGSNASASAKPAVPAKSEPAEAVSFEDLFN